RDLAAKSVDAKSEPEAWEFAARALSGNPYDIPFAVLYRVDEESKIATSAASAGIKGGNSFFPETVELSNGDGAAPYLNEVVQASRFVKLNQLEELSFSLPGGFWGVSPTELAFLPIAQTGQERVMGVLAVGVNCHKRLDDDYRGFLELVAGQIARSVADVRILEEERKRVKTQAELLNLANDAVFIGNLGNQITYWNRGAERLYGWSQNEVIGRHASELLQTEFPVPFSGVLESLARDGRWEGELHQTTRYGLRITVASRWIYQRNAKGEPVGWLEINSDMTPQRRAEEAARRLSGRILQVQDEERRKLARELHDSLGQYMAALKINTDACLRAAHDAKTRSLLADSVEIIQQCLSESRTMSYLLHPPLLDESGLSSALKWFVEGFGKRSGIHVNLICPAEVPRFSQEVETALFRILQESLANAHRHAATDRVDVEVKVDPHCVSLSIRDYGCGIAEERLSAFRDNGTGMGVGLGGMRER